ncbi:MAG: hypothetical protein WBD75_01385 [Phycisphaerae bacterium]
MVLGSITTVTIAYAYAEADANGGGNQNVPVRIVEADGGLDDLLDSLSVTLPRQLWDEKSGTLDNAINDAVLYSRLNAAGRIAASKNGTVIGPSGSGGEQNAQIAYEVGGSSDNSPETPVSGPAYSMAAPVIGTNPIPRDGTSTVTMNGICIEATGSTGDEAFEVRVIAANVFLDTLLHRLTDVTIPRPAGCFPGALIGSTSAVGTLTNPHGHVCGPDGDSGEETAEVGYEIGPSSANSPTVDVTAE